MKPVVTFQKQPRHFWAHVKLLSEGRGYSSGNKIKRYTLSDLKKFLTSYGLSASHLDEPIDGNITYGDLIITYIVYRADLLETSVLPNLMNREQAKAEFEQLHAKFNGTLPLVYNKQKGVNKYVTFEYFSESYPGQIVK